MGQAGWPGFPDPATTSPFSPNFYFYFFKKINYIYITTPSLFYFV
jgi:hypothetical protein